MFMAFLLRWGKWIEMLDSCLSCWTMICVECWILTKVSVGKVLALVLNAVFNRKTRSILGACDSSWSKLWCWWRALGWPLKAACLYRCSRPIVLKFRTIQPLLREALVLGANSILSFINFEFMLRLILKRSQTSYAGASIWMQVELNLVRLCFACFACRAPQQVSIQTSSPVSPIWTLLRKFNEGLSVRTWPKKLPCWRRPCWMLRRLRVLTLPDRAGAILIISLRTLQPLSFLIGFPFSALRPLVTLVEAIQIFKIHLWFI